LDHLVRLEEERRGNREAEGLGDLEVDDQFQLHEPLNGQVTRPGTFQDLVHVDRSTLSKLATAVAIGNEAPSLGKSPLLAHSGEPVRGRKVHDLLEVRVKRPLIRYEERVGTTFDDGGKDCVELIGMAHRHALQL